MMRQRYIMSSLPPPPLPTSSSCPRLTRSPVPPPPEPRPRTGPSHRNGSAPTLPLSVGGGGGSGGGGSGSGGGGGGGGHHHHHMCVCGRPVTVTCVFSSRFRMPPCRQRWCFAVVSPPLPSLSYEHFFSLYTPHARSSSTVTIFFPRTIITTVRRRAHTANTRRRVPSTSVRGRRTRRHPCRVTNANDIGRTAR